MLNRLTVNFSSLLQEPGYGLPRSRSSPFAWLEGAIAPLAPLPSKALGLSYPTPFLEPFLQFEHVLDYQASFTPLPLVESAVGKAVETDNKGWASLATGITTGLTSFFLDLLNPLNQTLTQLMEFQSNREIARSVQPFVLPDKSLEINLPIISQSELRVQSDRGFTERLFQNNQSFSQSTIVVTERLVQSISQFTQSESLRHFPVVFATGLNTILERFNPVPLERFTTAEPILQSISGSIAVNPTLLPGVLRLPENRFSEVDSPKRSMTNFAFTEVSQSPATNLPSLSRSEPQSESPPSVAPITFNGGIHVQITAQTIDPEHANETARLLAGQVLREITRIAEQDRFLRGLPPTPWR